MDWSGYKRPDVAAGQAQLALLAKYFFSHGLTREPVRNYCCKEDKDY